MKKKNFFSKLINIYTIIGFVMIFLALIVTLTPMLPYVIYQLRPAETENEVQKIIYQVSDSEDITSGISNISLPEKDSSLSTDPYVLIPSIGVESPISTSSDYTDSLKNGAWIVPDYGTPLNGKIPIIIAAHRFGYIYWDSATRQKISFYNLPKTNIGDTIDIIWDQRRFTYEIYNEEESTYISDYTADLILYTCKYFDSPVRIFRYARLITP